MASTLTASDEALRLVSLLEQQLTLYERLRKLGIQQAALVSQGSSEQLAAVLGQRQQLLDQAAQINQRLELSRARIHSVWEGVADARRTHVQGLVRQLQELMGIIMHQDEVDQAQLQNVPGRTRRTPEIHVRATFPARPSMVGGVTVSMAAEI